MATKRTIGPGFLTAFPWASEIRAAGGFAHFEDGDLQYVVMLDSVRMRVLHRRKVELFETTVDDDMKTEKGLAITGCFMDNKTLRGYFMKAGTTFGAKVPRSPDLQDFAGVVVEGGVRHPDSVPEPEKAMLAFKHKPSPQLLIDKGDPDPATGILEAFGGLGAAILKKDKIPSGKAGHEGLDRWYRVRDGEGDACGSPYIAISRNPKLVVAAVKPHGPKMSINAVRDRFADAGFDDVVFLDGGDSAYLNLNGTWVVRMGPYKNRITTFGTKLFYSSPP